jgi:hypothetical protein
MTINKKPAPEANREAGSSDASDTANHTGIPSGNQCGSQSVQQPDSASCTMLTATTPCTVTKEFSLDRDGNAVKKTTAHVSTGRMETREFCDATAFAALLDNLDTNQCLIYGIPQISPVALVTEGDWVAQGRPPDKLPRLTTTMHWPHGGGVLMLDYDAPKDASQPMTKDDLLRVLREPIPTLDAFDVIWWPSTSSCVWNGDKEIAGIRGQRLYLLVETASDIPRAGKVLNERLWAKGHGRFDVSKSGSLLERGMFDSTVWQTNRIDFAAGAKCHDGLEQRRGLPQIIEGKYEGMFNTRECIPNLAPEEVAAAKANKLAAKSVVQEEAGRVRRDWSINRVAQVLKYNPNINEDQAADIVARAVEHRELMGDWRITVLENGVDVEVAVLTVLDNPNRYHGLLTYDPLEPDYDGGRRVGKLFLFGIRPRLHSMAHGGVTFGLSRQPARIEIARGKSTDVADALITVLLTTPDVFDFGEELVIIGDNGALMPMDEHSLGYHAGRMTQFWRWHNVPNKGLVEVLEDPPMKVCKSVLSLKSSRGLKPLKAVITAPTLRPDGALLSEVGFDEATGLLFDTKHPPMTIPANPTKAQAMQAFNTLWKPFESFPFVDDISRAVHFAALLTAAVRPALKVSPGFGYDAPVQGSGKTLLAQCVAAVATGEEASVWPHIAAGNEDEIRKRLFTALRFGSRAILWDNVIGSFDSASMAAMLTSPNYSDRILGSSTSSSVPNRAILLLTGNNLTLTGDMSRRILVARIDPQTDKPFARCFDIDPLTHCLAHRQEMVAATLTLVRFYISTSPKRPCKSRMASFEPWDDWVRQTVLYTNEVLELKQFGDIMEQVHANQASDPEQEVLGELLCAWRECFGSDKKTSADVIDRTKGFTTGPDGRLREALTEFAPRGGILTSKSLGRILKYRLGRIVGGLRLECSGSSGNVKLWRVAQIADKSEERDVDEISF